MNYSRRQTYQSDEFEEYKNENDILVYCIDYIRNYRELSDVMMKKIEKLDDRRKMMIIKEYNRVTKALTDIISSTA
jgi:hypothetical protein